MSEHWCKTAEPYYSDVEKGIKPFEVRIDDRFPAYAVGDTLHLQQFTGGKLTGQECARTVTYALRDPAYVKDGYVVLGIMPLEDASPSTARELSCEGCKHQGIYEDWVENGYPSPCTICKRRTHDNYTAPPKED